MIIIPANERTRTDTTTDVPRTAIECRAKLRCSSTAALKAFHVQDNQSILMYAERGAGRAAKGQEETSERNPRAEELLDMAGHRDVTTGNRPIIKGRAILFNENEWAIYRGTAPSAGAADTSTTIGQEVTTMLTPYREDDPADESETCHKCNRPATYGGTLCHLHEYRRQRRVATALALVVAMVVGYALHEATHRTQIATTTTSGTTTSGTTTPSVTPTTYYNRVTK